MADYYFLSSYLPTLAIGHVPALGYKELKELFAINFTPEDKLKVWKLCQLIDLENIRALIARQPIDPRGNYSKVELEEALKNYAWPGDIDFPSYLKEYLDKYTTDEERLSHFHLLLSQFLDIEAERQQGFVREYFLFERQWRLVMLGFRAKKLGRDVAAELQYEDAGDPLVAQILAQKDARDYEPPFEYKELKPILQAYQDSPLELNRGLYEYRFNKIQDLYINDFFSVDRVLGYMERLFLVEKWLELDVKRGIEIVDKIEEGVSE